MQKSEQLTCVTGCGASTLPTTRRDQGGDWWNAFEQEPLLEMKELQLFRSPQRRKISTVLRRCSGHAMLRDAGHELALGVKQKSALSPRYLPMHGLLSLPIEVRDALLGHAAILTLNNNSYSTSCIFEPLIPASH